jgi:hypothetical protein
VSSPGGVDGTVSAQTLNPCALLTTDDIQPLAGNASVGDGVSSSLQSVSYVNCRFHSSGATSVRGTLLARVRRICVRQREMARLKRPGVNSRAFLGQLLSFDHPLDVAAIIYCSQCACLVLEEQPALSGNSLKRAE